MAVSSGIRLVNLPFIGRKVLSASFRALSACSSNENVSPSILILFCEIFISAANITCDGLTPLGTPSNRGVANCSGKASDCATKATDELHVPILSNIGVPLMPSSASRYFIIWRIISGCAELITGPITSSALSLKPTTHESFTTVKLLPRRSCGFLHIPYLASLVSHLFRLSSSFTFATIPTLPSADSKM